jgi:hypothetical protein
MRHAYETYVARVRSLGRKIMKVPHKWHFHMGTAILLGLVPVASLLTVFVCDALDIPDNGLTASAIAWGTILLLIPTCTWPIFQRLRIRPLASPRCPHCHKIPPTYYVLDEWPRYVMTCAYCCHPLEAWMGCRPPRAAMPSQEMPSFGLRWPEVLGVWRRLPSPPAGNE